MAKYQFIRPPDNGDPIRIERGVLQVPAHPIIPFIEGDGTGPDIWRATKRVLDAAVKNAYGTERQLVWMEVFAGEKSVTVTGEWLPDETLTALAP